MKTAASSLRPPAAVNTRDAEVPNADLKPAAAGPQAIGPGLLKLVAGGSPRGGWASTTDMTVQQLKSPRGGW